MKKETLEMAGQPSVTQEYEVRVAKVHALRAKGIEPWPGFKPVSITAHALLERHVHGDLTHYTLAGRIIAIRGHGKSIFVRIQDRSGSIQLYLKEDVVGLEQFSIFQNYIDLGDIIWVSGTTFVTKTGETTLQVSEFTLLSKSLHPLPDKFHGVADIEIRYRQRYLDLISNAESRQKFIVRSKIVSGVRHYLESQDFMEVETPMLHPIPGGAAAKPFTTHHNAYDMELFLRIAPELYLKRLVVGGFERVYEINRNFRNEGVSTRHNPEFTMLEFYMAHQDYHFAMDFVETLLKDVVQKSCGTLDVPFGQNIIEFSKPFTRLSVYEAVKQYGHYTEEQLAGAGIDLLVTENSIKLHDGASWGQKLLALFEHVAEPKLIQPTYIIDFPVETSPLAKRDEKNPDFVARFELFIGGMEIANSFNELNEPFDQRDRFVEQAQNHASGDAEAHRFDEDFVRAIEQGLPPTVGCGIGIDRLIMLATNTTAIKDVILFPTMKHK